MFETMIVVLDPANGRTLELNVSHGPRAITRALAAVFNDDPYWDSRALGACGLILADYTADDATKDQVDAVLRSSLLETYIP